MASTYLTRTFGSSPSTTLFTWSAWVKRNKLGVQQAMISGAQNSNTGQLIYFTSDDKFAYYAQAGGTVKCNLICDARLRDVNAWYHLVLVVDSSQASASDRVKFYVNNVEQSYTTTVAHQQNWDAYFMLTVPTDVGRNGMNTSDYFGGVMSHMHMTHGYNYTPSTFGSVDATTGEWKINTSPTVNYNSNGFFILKDGNTGTDHSGNSETFSSGGGTLTKTEDCPSNVFATWNPLLPHSSLGYSLTYSYGNNNIQFNESSTWTYVCSTLGANSGKYYFEAKLSTVGTEASVGIIELDDVNSNQGSGSLDDYVGKHTNAVGYFNNGRTVKNNNNQQTGLTALSAGSIVGVAMDLDNNTVQFYVNGSSVGNAEAINSDKTYFFGTSGYNSTKWECNFGNGYFADQTVSSAGTNASGNGIFEYDVPNGFTALSTKGLNE